MRKSILVFWLFVSHVASAQSIDNLKPYELPPKVEEGFNQIARENDVLVLGELHGTQEVPAVAVALLQPLSKLGYSILALEIPADQQEQLKEWALETRKDPPSFFAQSNQDGRGNMQVLALVRAALKPPFKWHLVCFDQSELGVFDRNAKQDPSDLIELSVRRDAAMADQLIRERQRIGADAKVLAICGNLHARTAKARLPKNASKTPDNDILTKLWPSFAAAMQIKQPNWRVLSVRVEPTSGTYSALVAVGDEPPRAGVHKIRSAKRVDQAELRMLKDGEWNWQLDLPQATAVTFLSAKASE